MLGLSPQELFIVFLIILLLFGGRKIPEIARGLGKGMREFKDGLNDIRHPAENTEHDSEGDASSSASDSRESARHPDDDKTAS